MAFPCANPTKTATIHTVSDEKFEEVYRPDEYAIQLVDDGRTCEKIKLGSYGCALGHYSYSSGIHRIRIRIDYGRAFIGIRSRNILPVSDEFAWGRYDCSPSTYGWIRDCGRICNGRYISLDVQRIERDNHVFTLTLNCDEYRLSILNENTNEKDEMEVDITYAPLPWCLFVQLPRTRGRLSLVQPTFDEASSLTSTKTSSKNQNIENDSSDTNTSSQQIPTPELKLSTSQDVASSTIPKKSPASIEKEVKAVTCNGNACSNCGKCREWYYDGNIDRDNERFDRGESYDIVDRNRWHRRPNGTCRYFYFHHVGILGKHHGLDICRCP